MSREDNELESFLIDCLLIKKVVYEIISRFGATLGFGEHLRKVLNYENFYIISSLRYEDFLIDKNPFLNILISNLRTIHEDDYIKYQVLKWVFSILLEPSEINDFNLRKILLKEVFDIELFCSNDGVNINNYYSMAFMIESYLESEFIKFQAKYEFKDLVGFVSTSSVNYSIQQKFRI